MPFWIPAKIDVHFHFDPIVIKFPTKIVIEQVEGMSLDEEGKIAARLKLTGATADPKPEGGES